MSKTKSNLFVGTQGYLSFNEKETTDFVDSRKTAEEIIAERAEGLDTQAHNIKNKRVLSRKEMNEVKKKIQNRTATMEEYKNYRMTIRLKKRRDAGVRKFWAMEKKRIINNLPTTREWTNEQKKAILSGRRPKHIGKTIQGHHSYSVKKYPHLANRGEIIYPITYEEHLIEWHGGNFSDSLPGKRIKIVK